MTTTEPKPFVITEFVTVDKVIPNVPGNNGPQKELHLQVPWSQYPVKFWIDENLPINPQNNEQCWVTFNRGALRQGKDPNYDYNYRWFIAKWGVEEPASKETRPPYSGPLEETFQASEAPATAKNTMPIWSGSTEQRIAWNSGVNNAIAYLSANPLVDKEGTHIRYDDPLWDTEFNYLAHKLYASIANGPDLDRWGPFIEDSTPDPEPEPEPEPEPVPAVTSSEELP